MSKKFLFRKFNWYIGRKMPSLLSDHFWLGYFACITPVNPHSSPGGVVLLLPLYKERYLSEASITWQWPGYSIRGHTQIQTLPGWFAMLLKEGNVSCPRTGEISLAFVPQASPLLKPTKCHTQGFSQMS